MEDLILRQDVGRCPLHFRGNLHSPHSKGLRNGGSNGFLRVGEDFVDGPCDPFLTGGLFELLRFGMEHLLRDASIGNEGFKKFLFFRRHLGVTQTGCRCPLVSCPLPDPHP